MKKLIFVSVFAVLISTLCFAAQGSGNGNGGADKIGGYVGWPIGLSYSHEFNDLVELDLLVGYTGSLVWHRFDFQLGALFTVFDPVLPSLGNQKCPLSLGPVIGANISILSLPTTFGLISGTNDKYVTGGFSILLPLRWEMNFGNIPDFNLFFDFAPVGVAVNFYKDFVYDLSTNTTKTKVKPVASYAFRAGVGLRYRIPNKK
ncbi:MULTISPECIES: hypothetical protein [unclassified Treponema]|uniref:hypothetical protein n=1 Tax=unclassified Treponema TaxID=2638727 RepID=UPI0020A41BA9|nr:MULTISPECIES: hypothetical protein [unclassified Treponema]UTC66880.1 hypothetical protein E4O06_13190 [Treponema sp. OMZ 789]UTC69609.1 hypothetical protein E4O01_13330 [Treponema sp. OMZ 790]UTC72323.1 hypothetical protein E4O02_13420 [Treponema sp. OMZ 791]